MRASPVVCPAGYHWTLSYPVVAVTPAEMQRRLSEMTKVG
jgi:hypothetical protein